MKKEIENILDDELWVDIDGDPTNFVSVIKNKDIAEKEKFNFDLLWEKAKR